MRYISVRYDSRVVIYERKMFIRLATVLSIVLLKCHSSAFVIAIASTTLDSIWPGDVCYQMRHRFSNRIVPTYVSYSADGLPTV